jgi:histidinol-phosphate aminotransferase
MNKYEKPAELYDGLRLHQNENTGGCSPRVLEALARLRPDQICFYPPYAEATAACATYFGVPAERLTLLNGLDEGIMAAAVSYLRPIPGSSFVPEAIIPEPAFEILAFDTEVVGGRPVRIPPGPDFELPVDEVVRAITPNTRVVFLTSPNNPTGVLVPNEAIRAIAARVPAGAVVFVDEAYAEFSGQTFIPELGDYPNVIVGRTFSKAFGLAGIRIGAITGSPEVLEPIRLAVPVYSVNVAAVVAVQAALADREFVQNYLRQVDQSKRLIYAACDRLSLRYWKSAANFVLVCAGDQLEAILKTAASRGVYLRDRSTEPGCAGCLRVSAGIVDHTKRFIDILDEVLCAAR